MHRLLALAAAALLSCGTRAVQEPCPGTAQGTFQLVAELVDGADCASSAGAASTLGFAAAVTFTGEDAAALCLERPLAEPLRGSRVGDRIDVAAPLRSGTARGCACTVELVERISGALERDGAAAVRFSGELTTSLAPADGAATCPPAESGGACAVPCTVRWRLTSG